MPVAGLLLTGGRSSRLGRDKATLPLPGGGTLATRAAAVLGRVAAPLLELGPGASGLPSLADADPGSGPLAALAGGWAALRRAGWYGPVLVVATDLPGVDERLLRWLAGHPAAGSVVPEVGGIPQWLCARYGPESLEAAARLVASGRHDVRALGGVGPLHLALPGEWAVAAGPASFADIDIPADLAHLRVSVPRSVTDVQALKVRPDRAVLLPDQLVTEEPLEIRAAGPGQEALPVAVTMRTPGADLELAAGFLVSEGLVGASEITGVGYCDAIGPDLRFNTVTVALSRRWVPPEAGRAFAATSSCGICGKAGIDQVELACPAVAPSVAVPATLVASLPDRLRAAQRVFERTGGLHAAGAFDVVGALLCAREDVGRHNAVDKVIGHRVLAPGEPATAVLMVSGRVSFEIVQKAAMAAIPVLAAVSAPSSLAVAAGERLGVTVAAFVRGGTFSVYSHPERIAVDR